MSDEVKTCTATTVKGLPCKNEATFRVREICRTHMTDDDRKIDAALAAEWKAGYHTAKNHYEPLYLQASRKLEEVRRQAQPKARDVQIAQGKRVRTSAGHQIVEVDGRYAYAWSGTPLLEIGEQVVCPPGMSGEWVGKVTGFGTDYAGSLAHIRRRVRASIGVGG